MEGNLLQGRYRLDKELGRGGMGVIYRAHDIVLDRDVAVKLLSDARLGTEGRARLLNEARAAARLNHPNIVSVYDAGESGGSPYIVMELVEGESLHDRPPRTMEEIIGIAAQVCAALAHAHSQGIIHRDLKPENVLVTERGTAKLTDFGLARSIASRLSGEGLIVGTVFYLAPELALGQAFDGRADLYALGVMLYELATGRLPFTADDPLAIISQHLHAPVVPPRAHNPAIPARLEALILHLLEKKAEDRPGSAEQVAQELAALDQAPAEPSGPEPSLLDMIARGRFVARRRELADAEARWQRARNGEGQVLLISGEPGIGKTRFVREAMTQAQVSGGLALSGECYAEGGAPYAPLAQMVRDTFDGADARSPVLSPSQLADLAAIAPDLRARFPDLPVNPALDPQAEQQRLFESVVTWCAALATRAPLFLFLDDAHWADASTLALLRHLARRTRRLPVLLVVTYREVELDQARPWNQVLLDLNRERLTTRIKLARLTHDETHELLNAIFQQEVAEDFAQAVFEETEGNPFFVEEVCKTLIEAGKLCFENGCWLKPDLADLEIPQSIRLAIQARVGNLSPEAQETLRVAAIIGREFDFDTLQRTSELEEETLITALESAQRAQLVEEVQDRNSHVTYDFVHALIHLTLLDSVGGVRRKRLHRRAAAAVESVHPRSFCDIARHYQEAGEPDAARTYYIEAGEQALAVYAYEEAEDSFRSALDLGSAPAEQLRALTGLGDALLPRGRLEEATDTWRSAIEVAALLDDYDALAELYTRASKAAWLAGKMPAELEFAQRGLAAMAGRPESPALARLLHETARAFYFNGKPAEARPLCEQALEIARRQNDVQAQAEALITLGLLYGVEHRAAEEEEAYRQGIQLAETANLPDSRSRGYHNLANLLLGLGRMREASQLARRAVEGSRAAGLVGLELVTLQLSVYAATAVGDYATAEGAVARIRELAAAGAAGRAGERSLQLMEAALLNFRGEATEAIERLERLWEQAVEQQDAQMWANVAGSLGDMLRDRGRLDQARTFYLASLEATLPVGGGGAEFAGLASLEAEQGNLDQAREYLARARALAGDNPVFGEKLTLGLASARLAVAERDWPAAFSGYEFVQELEEQAGALWYKGHSLREWAEAYILRNEPGDLARARERLARALELYRQCRCPGYVARVQARLDELA